ncbi:hypothetical protein FOYG_17438 [Fusarium oxysporum NRRL 32931]|uniref:Uncharacterized protein n=1 Tax=Fusarium oxysporum NRRL 32931 TaxID=660029 RepID=W9HEG5_FUSOX|nr:hypothetical protein FOYG_17438 [Fusarium oxysporum NRRL 32931]
MAIFADKSGGYCTCFPKQVNVNSYGRLNSCKGCYLSIPDEKSVYVAFRYVADMRNVGTKGLHRKSYIIKDIIEKQLYQPGVEELLKKYSMAPLISTLQTLLEGGIFTTHFAAKRRFPDLDHDMPTVCCEDEKPSEDIGAYREPTEMATEEKTDWEPEEATKPSCSYDDWPCEPEVAEEEEEEPKATEPLPEITEDELCMECDITLHTNDIPTSDTPTEEEKPKPADSEQSSEAPEDCDMTPKSPCKKANIDAVLLPFSSLYELLVGLQRYLERACFAYGRREIPATLSLNNWDCAEAVPLEHWMREFLDQSQNFSTIINNKNLKLLFKRVCKIQEVASQRIHIESDVLRGFLEDACELVHVLGDEKYKDLIGEFKSDIEKVLEDTQHKNTAYQNRRDGKLQHIESERAKLDKLEKAIRDEMDRDIRESQSMAKVEVRNALGKAAVTFKTEIEWKEEKAE